MTGMKQRLSQITSEIACETKTPAFAMNTLYRYQSHVMVLKSLIICIHL